MNPEQQILIEALRIAGAVTLLTLIIIGILAWAYDEWNKPGGGTG